MRRRDWAGTVLYLEEIKINREKRKTSTTFATSSTPSGDIGG